MTTPTGDMAAPSPRRERTGTRRGLAAAIAAIGAAFLVSLCCVGPLVSTLGYTATTVQ